MSTIFLKYLSEKSRSVNFNYFGNATETSQNFFVKKVTLKSVNARYYPIES